MLTVAMAATIFCRAALSVLAPILVRDLALTRAQIGMSVAAFSGTAAFCSLLAGRVTDRLPLRSTMTLAFAVPALAMALLSMANSFAAVLTMAMVAGVAGALGNPATNKAVATTIPANRQGIAIGIKQSGVQVGLLVAGLYLPQAERLFGWRNGLLVIAGLMAAGSMFCPLLSDRLGLQSETAPPPPMTSLAPHLPLYRHPPDVLFMARYAFLMGLGGNALFAYLPLYAHEQAGLSVDQAGVVATVVGGVAVLARVVAAKQSDTTSKAETWMLAMAVTALAFTLLLAQPGQMAWLMWPIAAGLGASTEAWNSVVMMGILLAVPAAVVGRASGLILMTFLLGSAVGPALFGQLVDHTGSYSAGFLAVAVLFAINLQLTISWRKRQRRQEQ